MAKKKKILFIITQSEMGGAQKYVHSIATNLDKEKYKVTVAAGPGGELLDKLAEAGVKTKKLRFLRRSINPLFDFLAFFSIRSLIKKEKPHIVYLHSSKAGILGSVAAKSSKAKVIYRIGGWVFNEKLSFLKKWAYISLERKTARFKDLIVVNSEFDKSSALIKKICAEDKIRVIYNGINAGKFGFFTREKARDNFFKILDAGRKFANRFIVGAVANFYSNKGLGYLVEAVKILNDKNIVFFIIGDGAERKKIEGLIKKYKLKNNIFLLGRMPDAYKNLKAFDLFVLPSVKEGMPWTILEAMAAGVPIIATKVGGVPEMIEDGEDGALVNSQDSRELAGAMKKIISNEALRDKFVMNSLETVKNRFSFEKMFNETEKLFL